MTRRSRLLWHGRALLSGMAGSSPAMTHSMEIERSRGRRFLPRRAPGLLRGDADLGLGGADVGVDVALERHEVLLEHADECTRGVVELRLVLPGLVRIEQVRLDAGELGRHGEAEIGIGAGFCVAQRAVERRREQRARHLYRHAGADAVFAPGPAGVDEPAVDAVDADQLAQQVAVDRRMPRQERRAEAGREFGLAADEALFGAGGLR